MNASALPTRMLDFCLVTADPDGPIRTVAEQLVHAGHRVTILDVREAVRATSGGPRKPDEAASTAVPLAGPGVRVVRCPALGRIATRHRPLARAWRAWQWCRGRGFDLIGFSELGGAGYFIAMARRLGLDFHRTALVACCEGPTMWRLAGNGRLPTVEDLAADHLERASVAWSDMVVCPTDGLLEWMAEEAWEMPDRPHVVTRRPPIPARASDVAGVESVAPVRVRELVYVGSLDRRSGLVTFALAVSRLPPSLTEGLQVTFLGATSRDAFAWQPQAWLESAMPHGVAWQVLDGPDAPPPHEYFAAPGRLALALGPTEHLPAIVSGCLARGVPFLACDTRETRALVHADDRETALCQPYPTTVAAAIAVALTTGVNPARAAGPPAGADAWPGVIADAVARRARVRRVPWPLPTDRPVVTVVVTHRNRPRQLAHALEGLRRQTFEDFDVVLVDDGSDHPDALAALDALVPEFTSRGWRIIRQANEYLGAARNRGWRASRAPLVLFHDDDNVAMPMQIERLVAAARYSGAAIITSAFATFEGDGPPEGDAPALDTPVTPFLGGALGLGLFENGFGDAQALVRRDVLESLNGFTEDFGVGHEDWELFARAALAGHEVLSIPEPLFWYRVSSGSMLRSRPDPEMDLRRNARAYTDLLPPVLRPVLLTALGNAQRMEAVQRLAVDERRRRFEAEEEVEEARVELARLRAAMVRGD
ncbi:MAG: glycosyltransferase [Vicinamibacterales bacterium]